MGVAAWGLERFNMRSVPREMFSVLEPSGKRTVLVVVRTEDLCSFDCAFLSRVCWCLLLAVFIFMLATVRVIHERT